MAQTTPSGSGVSKVESDVSQTLSLADSIVTLLREPVAMLYQNITKAKELKRSLGQWHAEAIDDDNQVRVPILAATEFEEYLVKTDCYLSPGAPHGKACWAHLLHALGIQPVSHIVGWRPPTDGFISTQNGGIEMEIEGPVLCHIINLYSVGFNIKLYSRGQTLPNRIAEKRCRFLFGELAWEMVDDQIHAHFRPGPEKELNLVKKPFGWFGDQFETDTLMISYWNALLHGSSDKNLWLPSRQATPEERMRHFVSSFDRLQTSRSGIILTSGWLREAARIKKRVLTRGGQDTSFLEDIFETIDTCDRDGYEQSNRAKKFAKEKIRSLFMMEEETFKLAEPELHSLDSFQLEPSNLAQATLDRYENEAPGSWKQTLFSNKADVVQVLCTSNEFTITPYIYLLDFDTDCPLWNQRVLLGAPSD